MNLSTGPRVRWQPARARAARDWLRVLLPALMVGVLLSGCGDRGPAGPALSLQASTVNVGSIVPGKSALESVSLTNTGHQDLLIRYRSTDPALRAALSATRIAPGATATLRLDFSSDVWDPGGNFAQSVFIYSNDPRRRLAKVAVVGTVTPPFYWQPKVPLLPPLQRGSTTVLVHVAGHAIGPIDAVSMVPNAEASAISEPSGYKIELTVDRDAPLGSLTGLVRVDTFNRKLPEFYVPVRTVVVHNELAVPYEFDFGLVRAGGHATATAGIQVRTGQTVRIVRVEAHLPAVAGVSVTRHGVNSSITLHIHSVPRTWSLAGYVNVYTTDPTQPLVQLPVVGTVWTPNPFRATATGAPPAGLYGALRAALFIGQDVLSPERIVDTVLGGVRDQRSVSLLLRALHDQNWYVRQRAVDTLGYLRSTSALAEIRAAVTDDIQAEVRQDAVDALARIEGKASLPTLVLALQDNDLFVRVEAARVLGRLGDPRALAALRAVSRIDPEPVVRQVAAMAVKALAR